MKVLSKRIFCILFSVVIVFAAVFQSRVLSVRADSGFVMDNGYIPLTGEEFDTAFDQNIIPSTPKEEQRRINEWVSRKPLMASAAGTANEIAGIKINLDTKSTGMYSWTPGFDYNQLERSSDWISFWTTSMTDLKAGDVIVWEDDYSGGALVNHIAIIVEVAPDFSWYLCADGNCPVNENRPTGIDFVYRTTLQKYGSSSGHVCIWRNMSSGPDIAESARAYTQRIIDTVDMSFNNEYNSIGWGWCYCYVVEMLLATKDAEGRELERVANERFSDVIDRSASNYKPIQWAAEMGIVVGYKDGTFRPADNCTRAQFVVMLWRMAGRPDTHMPEAVDWSPFSDVTPDMSAFRAICWANNEDIIRGYSDGTFRPSDNLTRAQIVVMIWRLLGRPAAEAESTFADADPAASNFRAIQWAAFAGVIKGYKDGNFGPQDNCTRSQLATILYRAVREGLMQVEKTADDNEPDQDLISGDNSDINAGDINPDINGTEGNDADAEPESEEYIAGSVN